MNALPNPNPIVIVGAGLAGLFAALKLAPLPTTVITAAPLGEGASSGWAQGGIAAAVGEDDTPEAHAFDTMAAGADLVDAHVARLVATEAADGILDLLSYGTPFDKDLAGRLVLSREAAHSAKRIVRVAGDGAGKAIMTAIIEAVRKTPSIQVLEGFTATELIREGEAAVSGIYLAREHDLAARYALRGVSAVLLATGGIGSLYAVTTNTPYARGNGIAMAARAGAVLSDAEFVQFHPTAIDVDTDPPPLATEALRGEGAILVNAAGERFMAAHHPDAELAPRDIVAHAVFREIQAGRSAFLDCREAIGEAFPQRFPTVYQQCREAGIDPVTQPIPVAPAAHYHMGGIKTDENGRTTVPSLWAIGEVAATGLHGANRLASNSLLEAIVFANRAAASIAQARDGHSSNTAKLVRERTPHLPDTQARGTALALIRAIMTDNVGVERNGEGLKLALDVLQQIEDGSDGDIEIENLAIAARFIAESALRRRESRGSHLRTDYTETDPAQARHTTMTLAGLNLRNHLKARKILADLLPPDAQAIGKPPHDTH